MVVWGNIHVFGTGFSCVDQMGGDGWSATVRQVRSVGWVCDSHGDCAEGA